MNISGILRKISYLIAIDPRIAGSMREPGWSAVRSLSQKKLMDPAAQVLALRQNPKIPRRVYPALAITSTGKIVSALVLDKTIAGNDRRKMIVHFEGTEQSVQCLGNSYEADARDIYRLSPTLNSIPVSLSGKYPLFAANPMFLLMKLKRCRRYLMRCNIYWMKKKPGS